MYIDPGTGGIIFQVLLVFFGVISGAVLLFYGKIKMWAARLRRNLRERAGDESPSASSTDAD